MTAPSVAPRVGRAARAVAIALVGGAVVLVAIGLVSFALYVGTPVPETLGWPFTVAFSFGVLTFAASGGVIAATSPGNRIGWIVLLIGVVGSLNFAIERAGAYLQFVRAESLGNVLLAASSPLAVANTAVLLTLVPLIFPDGRLPSPRWRPVVWLAVSTIILTTIGSLASEQVILLGLPNAYRVDDAYLGIAFQLGVALILAGTVAAVASLIDRYRQAEPTVRLQIRWFVYAAALFGGLVISVVIVLGVTADPTIIALLSAAHSLFPLAITIAVLRYRLYDIDVLIRRTLVYGLTTGSLAVAFFTGIVLLQALLRPFTTGSEIAVAGSTLASVALFQPLRSRIQAGVDRRFYRSRYDAERTLDRFARELAEEVDLSAVRGRLLAVTAKTFEPSHVSVWFRDQPR
jgi:hypothetical protein